MSKIVSIASAVPPYEHEQAAICSFADKIYCNNPVESRKHKFLYAHSGIQKRYSVIPDYSLAAEDRMFYAQSEDLEPFPSLEQRMDWYNKNATDLSVAAIEACIKGKVNPSNITHLVTVSCTGMSAPGLDLEIMEAMQLPSNIFRTSINFMGCYAAIHGLKLGDALAKADENANVLIVCTELCTLHFQKEPSGDNITSTLIFGDGCAAVLMQNSKGALKGIQVDNFYSDVLFKGKKDMSWQLSSEGFKMVLSGYVPDLVKEDFNGLLNSALGHAKLDKEAVTHWCIHPGGKKILEAIGKSVELPGDALKYSYAVLNDYGNMSSPTILFVLEKIWKELQEKQEPATIFGAAFGPGLTMETFMLSYD